MIDLETLGTGARAAVLSIGAVAFDLDEELHPQLGLESSNQTFYANVDLQSCLDCGMEVDGSTFYWWLNQSEEARKALQVPAPVSLSTAMAKLEAFLVRACGPDVHVWSHGATFDLVILDESQRLRHVTQGAWKFRNQMDTRTLYRRAGFDARRDGAERVVRHNALHDAVAQARDVVHCWKLLAPKGQ